MLLWTPTKECIEQSNLKRYMDWLNGKYAYSFNDYSSLWRWSTDHPELFWRSIWDYFEIIHDGEIQKILSDDPMPHTRWFEGTRLNYAQHVFRKATSDHPAIISGSESGEVKTHCCTYT